MSSPVIVGVALRDDDEAPFALAEMLAGLTGAPLALVALYPYGAAPLFVTPAWVTSVREQAEHALDRVAEQITTGIEVSVHVRPETSAALALHDAAIELDAAAIVVGSSHRGRLGRVLAGSVGAGVLHGAPRPVAIAPRGYEKPSEGLRRIGVGFVDTPEGRGALTAARGIARATRGTVTAFAVEEPIEWSRSSDLDLLVCGSRGYGPVRSVMLGSVSRALAHSARCPLLVVPRPPAEDATKLWRNRTVAHAGS